MDHSSHPTPNSSKSLQSLHQTWLEDLPISGCSHENPMEIPGIFMGFSRRWSHLPMDFGSESAPQNPHGHPDQWQHCSSRWARNLGSWGFFVGSLDILDVDFGKPCDFIMDHKRFPKIIQSYGLDFFNLVFFWDDFINPKIIPVLWIRKTFLFWSWCGFKKKKKNMGSWWFSGTFFWETLGMSFDDFIHIVGWDFCDDFLGLFVVFVDDVDWDFGWKNCDFWMGFDDVCCGSLWKFYGKLRWDKVIYLVGSYGIVSGILGWGP